MKTYLIKFDDKIVSIFFNEKSPLSGIKQYFKSNYPNIFDRYIEENRNGKMFNEFLREINCKFDVVEHFDYTK